MASTDDEVDACGGSVVLVKARAVILIDGLLIVANQRRRGESELSLPGGRVTDTSPCLTLSNERSRRRPDWRSSRAGSCTCRK